VLTGNEIEINQNLLSFPDYNHIPEINDAKSRIGIYVNSKLDYVRRLDLEGLNSDIVIIDLKTNPQLRIVNVYRSFNQPNSKRQLGLLKLAINNNSLLMGDFNSH
jgi:hypothetical protein